MTSGILTSGGSVADFVKSQVIFLFLLLGKPRTNDLKDFPVASLVDFNFFLKF